MHLVTTKLGTIYVRTDNLTLPWAEKDLPDDIFAIFPVTRPSFSTYKRRTYISGQHNELLVFTENKKLVQGGITATSTAPTVAVGSGTGITASSVRYYYSMAHYESNRLVHESNLSSSSAPINISNKNVVLTGLPITHSNPRVNYKRIYRSDNGGIPRFVARVQLKKFWASDPVDYSTYTDSTPTLSLGEIRTVNNDVPPYTKYNKEFHDRMFYAGNPSLPHLLYYSEVGRPEAVGSTSNIPTKDGEAITGLAKVGDELIVFCNTAIYKVLGYGPNDFVMKKISSGVGCISHHTAVNIDEVLWFASPIGVYTYDGALHFQMEKLRDYWRTGFRANTSSYLDAIAINDTHYNGYLLLVKQTSSAFLYFGHYFPTYRGLQPAWVFDTVGRLVTSLGVLGDPGTSVYEQYMGGSGALWTINNEATAEDYSATKACVLQTGAQLFGDPGGNKQEGKSFGELWTYVQSEATAWTLYALGGDEDCVNAHTPDNVNYFWKDDRAASAIAGKTAESVHYHQPERVSGRALSIKITVDDVADFRYRGFGGTYGDGEAARPAS